MSSSFAKVDYVVTPRSGQRVTAWTPGGLVLTLTVFADRGTICSRTEPFLGAPTKHSCPHRQQSAYSTTTHGQQRLAERYGS